MSEYDRIVAKYLLDSGLYLLTLERKGWRRWVFGRWAYNSEPFRNDIARRLKHAQFLVHKNQKRLRPTGAER